jgi:hypothetical protein
MVVVVDPGKRVVSVHQPRSDGATESEVLSGVDYRPMVGSGGDLFG